MKLKKLLAVTMILGFVFLGTSKVSAYSISDLKAEIASLRQELVDIKASLSGAVGSYGNYNTGTKTNGGWSAWTNYYTCNNGKQAQIRTCTNPKPANGGANCPGSSYQIISCGNTIPNTNPNITTGTTPINGGWSAWTNYYTCNNGKQAQTRSCNNPVPANGGANCQGSSYQIISCGAVTTTPTTSTPSITVLSPNGGEIFNNTNDITVTWKSQNISAGANVVIGLSSDSSACGPNHPIGGCYKILYQSTENDGVQIIPSSMIEGYDTGKFRISVSYLLDTNIRDSSDNEFTINKTPTACPIITTPSSTFCANGQIQAVKNSNGCTTSYVCIPNTTPSAPSITVLSPNGGEVYKAGDKITIKWKSINTPDNSVTTIALVDKNGNNVYLMDGYCNDSTPCVSFHSGDSEVNIPKDITPGLYKARVVCSKSESDAYCVSPGNEDLSDNYFTINSTPIACPTPSKPVCVGGQVLVPNISEQTGCITSYKCSAAPISCTDSDGGINLDVVGFTDGRINGIGASFNDTSFGLNGVDCSGTDCTGVSEGYCENNAVTNRRYQCPSGYSVNGACVAKTAIPSLTVLWPKNEPGIVMGAGQQVQVKWAANNFKSNENILIDLFDQNGGIGLVSFGVGQTGPRVNDSVYMVTLPLGPKWSQKDTLYRIVITGTQSGVKGYSDWFKIIPQQITCADTDNGQDRFTYGELTITNRSFVSADRCYDLKTGPVSSCSGSYCSLEEFYCVDRDKDGLNESDASGVLNEPCPNGCSNGACLPSLPDLKASFAYLPTSFNKNTISQFTTIVSNIGNVSTTEAFPVHVEINNGKDIINVAPSKIYNPVYAGGTEVTNSSYMFTEAGSYQARTCANQYSSVNTAGYFKESSELNNCSAWSSFTVSDVPAKINGGWSAWTNYYGCSNGKQAQTRSCNNPAPANGGAVCAGDYYQTIPCAVNGGWSAWTNMGSCSSHKQVQLRSCNNPAPANGGAACVGVSSQVIAC